MKDVGFSITLKPKICGLGSDSYRFLWGDETRLRLTPVSPSLGSFLLARILACLVEDRGFEPLTLTCKASVFPISTNPPIIISYTLSNVSYKTNCSAMQPVPRQGRQVPICFIRYHLYSCVIATVSSGRPPVYSNVLSALSGPRYLAI